MGGADIEVTPQNVYDYIRKYAEFRMVKTSEKALEVRTNSINEYFTLNEDTMRNSIREKNTNTFFYYNKLSIDLVSGLYEYYK